MLLNAEIAERAYNETVHPSNPQWKDIANSVFRNNHLQEVVDADAGRSSDTPFGHAVAALVATRKIEFAKEAGMPYTDEKGVLHPASKPVDPKAIDTPALTPVPNPGFDAKGNPLPTPGAGPTRVPVVPVNAASPTGVISSTSSVAPEHIPGLTPGTGFTPQPVHSDSLLASQAETKRVADEKQARIEADLAEKKLDAGKVN